jgi:hypothetical protein
VQKLRNVYMVINGQLAPIGGQPSLMPPDDHPPFAEMPVVERGFYISHFETCPDAGSHSRRR